MAISRLYTFATGATILAAEHNGELDQLVTEVNKMVKKDGTVAFTGHVSLVDSSPTNALHAASKGYADALLANTALTGTTTATAIDATGSISADVSLIAPLVATDATDLDLGIADGGSLKISNKTGGTVVQANLDFDATSTAKIRVLGASTPLTISTNQSGIDIDTGVSTAYLTLSNLPTASPGGADRVWVDVTDGNRLKLT